MLLKLLCINSLLQNRLYGPGWSAGCIATIAGLKKPRTGFFNRLLRLFRHPGIHLLSISPGSERGRASLKTCRRSSITLHQTDAVSNVEDVAFVEGSSIPSRYLGRERKRAAEASMGHSESEEAARFIP